jgi:hypothetical protein
MGKQIRRVNVPTGARINFVDKRTTIKEKTHYRNFYKLRK